VFWLGVTLKSPKMWQPAKSAALTSVTVGMPVVAAGGVVRKTTS
jgi:hypothetical protein